MGYQAGTIYVKAPTGNTEYQINVAAFITCAVKQMAATFLRLNINKYKNNGKNHERRI